MDFSSSATSLEATPNTTLHHAVFQAWRDAKYAENLEMREVARLARASQHLPLVLVVDDEMIVAVTLTEILRRKGFNAVWFNRSTEALAYVQNGPIDLLLTDLAMPDLDGVELVTKVYDLIPTCRFLLFSALSDCPNTMERVGCLTPRIHVEAKPLAVEKLVSTLMMLLEQVELGTSVEGLLEASARQRI